MTNYEVDPDDVYDPQIARLAEWTDSTPEAVLSRLLDDAIPQAYMNLKQEREKQANQREQLARAAAQEEVAVENSSGDENTSGGESGNTAEAEREGTGEGETDRETATDGGDPDSDPDPEA